MTLENAAAPIEGALAIFGRLARITPFKGKDLQDLI